MEDKKINYLHSSEVNLDDATPMLRQFLKIKKEHPDTILLYRMGDFYETFFEDAVTTAKDIEITLTSREGGKLGRIPMAGVPVKSVDRYIAMLLEQNHKIAICEQTQDPSEAKGLVERKVVKTITAGTITDSNLLDSTKNNYLAAIFKEKDQTLFGLAYIDISTGEFKITQTSLELLISEMARINPSEIIAPVKQQKVLPFQVVPEEIIDLPNEIKENYNCSKVSYTSFKEDNAIKIIKECFKINSIEAFGYPEFKLGIQAAGAIIDYIYKTQQQNVPKFDVITPYSLNNYVLMDANTRKNLELSQTVRDGSKKGSLIWAIDKASTKMGKRLLDQWIQQPLQSINEINLRQNAVEELISNSKSRLELSSLLDKVYDIERLSMKISNNSINPREFISIKNSLALLPEFKNILENFNSDFFNVLKEKNEEIEEFVSIVDRTLLENPSIGLKEGNIINTGVNAELDYQKSLLTGGREWLENFENTEKEKTGVKSLKVGYSKTFGYFIEITHSNKDLVPDYYTRKQTLTNAERYITPELKAHEKEVLSAQSKSIELEYKIYCDLREYAKEYIDAIKKIAEALSSLDVLLSFAMCAIENNYVRPIINKSNNLLVKGGRHPVIEQLLPMGKYVANDLYLNANAKENECQFMILTGPNMAGKSTFMRQNALIAILAQIGSFVPAREAYIGIIDKIFTRVGSVDDLSMGQSTFMVEMNETASILNSATSKSLILLDEIGRGTSTYDGVAIAWSVSEYITKSIGARTIFATHYHELNVMCNSYPQIKNYRITIAEKDGNIEFLRQVVPGGTSKSYGIQVAKMAGLPDSVIDRASGLMTKMQKDYSANISTKKKNEPGVNSPQLSLFIEE